MEFPAVRIIPREREPTGIIIIAERHRIGGICQISPLAEVTVQLMEDYQALIEYIVVGK